MFNPPPAHGNPDSPPLDPSERASALSSGLLKSSNSISSASLISGSPVSASARYRSSRSKNPGCPTIPASESPPRFDHGRTEKGRFFEVSVRGASAEAREGGAAAQAEEGEGQRSLASKASSRGVLSVRDPNAVAQSNSQAATA